MKFEQVQNPQEGPWPEIEKRLRTILLGTQATLGLIMLEKDGSIAAVIGGEHVKRDNTKLLEGLRLFQERLTELIAHAEKTPLQEMAADINYFGENIDSNLFMQNKEMNPNRNN